MLLRACPRYLLLSGLGWLFIGGVLVLVCTAQVTTTITPDGRLGTEITQTGGTYEIRGGTRPQGGRNLFHGFDRFSVGTPDTAHFAGAAGIETIIGRVTGGERSEIDGRLSSDATLFLLNPSGMVFGPNASLDVRGSFYASTADEIRFADGSAFRADLGQTSTLTVAPPVAFGFLPGSSPATAPMVLSGSNLSVPAGETLSLVGGPMTIAGGQLQAPGGTLHIASVAAVATDLNLPLPATDAGLDGIAQPAHRLGDITISDGAVLDTSGSGGGTVVIRGGALKMQQSFMTANNDSNVDSSGRAIDMGVTGAVELTHASVVSAVALEAGQAGDVVVRADAVRMADSTVTVGSSAAGVGGSVSIAARRVDLTDSAAIVTNALQSGRGGDVHITAAEAVTMTDKASLSSLAGPGGLAGDILINAKDVALVDAGGGRFPAAIFSSGQAGDVSIIADEVTLANSSIQSEGALTGTGGMVTIQARRVTLAQGATMTTAARGDSTGGSIQVSADHLTLDNARLDSSATAGARAGKIALMGQNVAIVDRHPPDTVQAGIFSAGQAGHIEIGANEVTIANGFIDARGTTAGRGGDVTIHGSRLALSEGASITTGGSQRAPVGDVIVQMDTVRLENASIASSSREVSPGNVLIDAKASIDILEQADSGIEAGVFSFGGREQDQTSGKVEITSPRLTMYGGTIGTPSRLSISIRAGNVNVDVGALMLQGPALINTSTNSNEAAGTVRITATDALLIDDAAVSAETTASGGAGRIEIVAERLTLDGNARISSESTGPGHAGAIGITAGVMQMHGTTVSAATTGSGNAGQIEIAVDRGLALLNGSQITSNTTGPGDAGTLQTRAEDVDLKAGSRIATAAEVDPQRGQDVGRAGDIEVHAERLTLDGGSQITSESTGLRDAGSINIRVDALTLRENSEITTAAVQANGGNITIQGRRVLVQDSAISTATIQGGAGGNIHIAPHAGVVALLGSEVKTSANIGTGGNIAIGTLLVDADSRVDASGGIEDGEVELGTAVNLGALTPLPQNFAADAPLLNELCAQRLRGGQVSSFVVAGRDGLPADPSGALPSPMIEEPRLEAMLGQAEGAGAGDDLVPLAASGRQVTDQGAVDTWLQAMHAYPCAKRPSEKTAIQHTP